jgi:hypothetical protein
MLERGEVEVQLETVVLPVLIAAILVQRPLLLELAVLVVLTYMVVMVVLVHIM